jgi:hypothetical protein
MIPVAIDTQNLGWSYEVITRFAFYMKDLLVSNDKYLGYYILSNIKCLWTFTNGNY